MSISTAIRTCINDIQRNAYICTSAEYIHPDTQASTPIIERTSLDFDDSANALIVFGDNASGKSLICSLIEAVVSEKSPTRRVCIKNRVTASPSRAFIFGDESTQSTGETSVRVIQKALAGAKQDDEPSLIILDEPDFGLSAKYSRALGRYLAQHIAELCARGSYLVIVSHSTPLLEAFNNELEGKVSFFGINTHQSLDVWLADDTEKSLDELLGLTRLARLKESAISREMEKVRREGR